MRLLMMILVGLLLVTSVFAYEEKWGTSSGNRTQWSDGSVTYDYQPGYSVTYDYGIDD